MTLRVYLWLHRLISGNFSQDSSRIMKQIIAIDVMRMILIHKGFQIFSRTQREQLIIFVDCVIQIWVGMIGINRLPNAGRIFFETAVVVAREPLIIPKQLCKFAPRGPQVGHYLETIHFIPKAYKSFFGFRQHIACDVSTRFKEKLYYSKIEEGRDFVEIYKMGNRYSEVFLCISSR